MKKLSLLLALVAGIARADAPEDYAFGISLTTRGDAAFYRVELPPALYDGITRVDLSDVRVFNGDGATVPFAVLTRTVSTTSSSATVALPLFPLKTASTTSDLSGLTMSLDRTLAGTSLHIATRDGRTVAGDRLVGYVLDASDAPSVLKAVELAWPPASGSMTRHVKVEASEDLAAWHTVVADAALIDLEFEGRRLLRNRIELPASRFRYLRLTWNGGEGPFEISSVTGLPADTQSEPARQWRDVAGVVVAQHQGEFEFDLGGRAPIDRISIDLPEINSVVPAQVLSRDASSAPWVPVTSLIAYRLRGDEQDLVPSPIAVSPSNARYWLLRADPRSGGMRGVPRLRAGGPTQEIIFAARGAAPYTIVYGSATAAQAMLPLATLVPGYGTAAAPAIGSATVAAGVPRSLGGATRLAPPVDSKRYALWSVLLLGVLMLGWMAWRLLAQINATPKSATSPAVPGAAAPAPHRDA